MSRQALPDILAPDLDVIFVGINPGHASAAARCHYAHPRNAFWRALFAAGFTPRLLRPDEQEALPHYGVGLTNAVARTTRGSAQLRAADFAHALGRLVVMAERLRPGWLAFVGKDAYAPLFRPRRVVELGVQAEAMGGAQVFVLPSTSPANAVLREADKIASFKRLHEEMERSRRAERVAPGGPTMLYGHFDAGPPNGVAPRGGDQR